MIAENRAALAARQALERLDLAEQQAAEVVAFEGENGGDVDDVRVEHDTSEKQVEAIGRVLAFVNSKPFAIVRRGTGQDVITTAREVDLEGVTAEFPLLHSDLSRVLAMVIDARKPKVIVERPLTQCLHTADCDAGCRSCR